MLVYWKEEGELVPSTVSPVIQDNKLVRTLTLSLSVLLGTNEQSLCHFFPRRFLSVHMIIETVF